MLQKIDIIIIGTGRVAKSLGLKFNQTDSPIKGVWGRNKNAAFELSKELETCLIPSLQEIPKYSLVLICISDTAIEDVINQIPQGIKIAYTSGSIRLEDLSPREDLGVFYPLQTFSDNRPIDLSNVPFLIEATTKEFELELKQLAEELSSTVLIANSDDRYNLHIAAVMVNNFTNYLFLLAKDHLEEHHLNFDLLKPLIKETINKLDVLDPIDGQTGPAARGDKDIVEKHIQSITQRETQQVYQLFSELIEKRIKKL